MDSNACIPKIFSPMLVTISMVDAFFGVCLETGIPQCLKSLLSQTQNELHISGKFGDKGDNYTIFSEKARVLCMGLNPTRVNSETTLWLFVT